MNLVIEKGVTWVVIGKVDVVLEGAGAVVIAGMAVGDRGSWGNGGAEQVGAGRR